MRNKALEPQQNDALRALVREVIDTQFAGKVSVAAAAKPKISHSLLFEFLDGRRGAGMKLLEWVSARTGRGIDDLLGRHVPPPSGGAPIDLAAFDSPRSVGHIPLWHEKGEEAMALYPWITPADLQRASVVQGVDAPSPMTVEYILETVKFVQRAKQLREQAEAGRSKVEAEIRKHTRDYDRREKQKGKAGELPLEGGKGTPGTAPKRTKKPKPAT